MPDKKKLSIEKRAGLIHKALKKAYPDAHCELDFRSPLELLVATILSAQCTDVRVNKVTPALFKKYKTAKDYANADAKELEELVRSTGFYKNKARSIQKCCLDISQKYGGKVPEDMDDLTSLAGVGRKTANVIRAYAFDLPGITCDTHVLRITKRLGLTTNDIPEKVEADIAKILPQKDWTSFSTVIVTHGRRCCYARKPNCSECPVLKLCLFPDKNL